MTEEDRTPFWRRRGWLAQTGSASAAIYLSAILGFVTSIVMVRALGPGDFGAIMLAVATVASIVTLLDFSLEEAVVHFGAVALSTNDVAGTRGLIRRSLTLDVIVGLAVFIAVAASSGLIASLASMGRVASVLIVLAAVDAFVGTANGTNGAVLLLGGRPDLRAWALAWTTTARLLFVLIAVRVAHANPKGVLVALACGSAVGAVLLMVAATSIRRRRWGGVEAGPPPISLRRLAGFGAQSSVTTSLIALRLALVTVVLGRTAGPTAVGFLSVAVLPVTIAEVATSPLRTTAFAEQAKLAAAGRLSVLWNAIRGYTWGATAVGLAASAIGWFLIPVILPALYGERFRADIVATRLLLPAAVASLAVAWAKSLPAAIGKPRIRTLVSLVELAATVVAVLALAHRGAQGVAAAISVVAVAMAVVWVIVARGLLVGEPRGSREDEVEHDV